MALKDIGEGDDALFCVTDQPACCRHPHSPSALGNWYFPNGTRVPSSGKKWEFHRTRGQMVVSLHRRRGGVDGIYHCKIPGTMGVIQTIYIGVYTASTGKCYSVWFSLGTSTLITFDYHLATGFHFACSYIPAGSPNVTSLFFDVHSTTLTCTSTGGPTTTVTWRRDQVVITLNATHQQTKRLVDAVAGTYQTVLTIDPSVGHSDIVGTYNCTVENVRGESSETVDVPGMNSFTLTYILTSIFISQLRCTFII